MSVLEGKLVDIRPFLGCKNINRVTILGKDSRKYSKLYCGDIPRGFIDGFKEEETVKFTTEGGISKKQNIDSLHYYIETLYFGLFN